MYEQTTFYLERRRCCGPPAMDALNAAAKVVLLLATIVIAAHCACSPPAIPDALFVNNDTSTVVTEPDTVRSLYSPGDIIVYSCDRDKGGYGVVTTSCQADGGWSAIQRTCFDAIPADAGSIGGIAVASFTLLTSVFFIVYATLKFPTPGKGDGSRGSQVALDEDNNPKVTK